MARLILEVCFPDKIHIQLEHACVDSLSLLRIWWASCGPCSMVSFPTQAYSRHKFQPPLPPSIQYSSYYLGSWCFPPPFSLPQQLFPRLHQLICMAQQWKALCSSMVTVEALYPTFQQSIKAASTLKKLNISYTPTLALVSISYWRCTSLIDRQHMRAILHGFSEWFTSLQHGLELILLTPFSMLMYSLRQLSMNNFILLVGTMHA